MKLGGLGKYCELVFRDNNQKKQENPIRTPAETVYDAFVKAEVVKSEDDLTPEMLDLMKETNEATALLKIM